MINFEQFITELTSQKVSKPFFPGTRDVRGGAAGDHLWISPKCKNDINKFSEASQMETRAFFKYWIENNGKPPVFEYKHKRTIGKWPLWVVEVRMKKPAIHLFFREGMLNVDKDGKDIKGKTKHRIYAAVRAFEGYDKYRNVLNDGDSDKKIHGEMPTKTDGFNRLIIPKDLQRIID
jgi:hypothetical protein